MKGRDPMIARTLITSLAFFVGLLAVTVFAQHPARGGVGNVFDQIDAPITTRTYQMPVGTQGQVFATSGTWTGILAVGGGPNDTGMSTLTTGSLLARVHQDEPYEYTDDTHCYVMSTKMLYQVFNTMGFDEEGKARPRNKTTLVYVTPYEMWRGNKEMYNNIRQFYNYKDVWQVDIDEIQLNYDGSFWDMPKRVDCPAEKE